MYFYSIPSLFSFPSFESIFKYSVSHKFIIFCSNIVLVRLATFDSCVCNVVNALTHYWLVQFVCVFCRQLCVNGCMFSCYCVCVIHNNRNSWMTNSAQKYALLNKHWTNLFTFPFLKLKLKLNQKPIVRKWTIDVVFNKYLHI